jgi:hypothetical protein
MDIGRREPASESDTIQLSDSAPQRVDAVARQLGLLASPLKQRSRRLGNQVVPVMSRLFVIGFLVHFMPIQTKNPGLDIALWDQPHNLLTHNINALFSTILQGPIELPPSILNRMSVCIDYYD